MNPAFRSRCALSAVVLLWLSTPVLAAEMQYPARLATDGKSTLYVADRNLPGVWKITDGKLELYVQGTKFFRTPLNALWCVAVDGQGRVLAGDSSTREVYRIGENKELTPLTTALKEGEKREPVDPNAKSHFGNVGIPMSIALNSKGEIFIADLEIHRIVKIPSEGGEPQEFAVINAPRGLAFDAQDRLWVVTGGKEALVRYTPDGKKEVLLDDRPFEMPHNLALDDDLNAYITDNYAGAVWKVPAGGKPEKWVQGKPLQKPVGIVRQGDRLYVADPHAKQIFSIDFSAKIEPAELQMQ